MSWIEALILGVVQGLTEFLPVSSSGHLEIGQALLGTASEEDLTFAIVVHIATVLSTIVIFRQEIWRLLYGTLSTTKWNDEKDYVAKILVSMIPVFVVGMFFKDYVEQIFGSGLVLVGICLIITALLLGLSDYITRMRQERALEQMVRERGTATGNADLVEQSKQIGKPVDYKSAFIIGLAQAIAVLPGLSRSGSTIATGLLCGVKKEAVAQFSFLMVLIPILGEALLDGLKMVKDPTLVTSLPVSSLAVGFVAAFATGCFACKFMLEIVRRQKLMYFAIYCVMMGIFAIVYGAI